MRCFLFGFFLLCASFFLSAQTASIELITADEIAPFAMQNSPEGLHGICVDLLQAVSTRMKLPLKITYYPWLRAQNTVQNGTNLILAPLVRNATREKQYVWLFELGSVETAFVSIDGKQYDIETAKALKSVMVQTGTAFLTELKNAQFTNLDEGRETNQMAKRLEAGRGNTWFVSVLEAQWIWKSLGFAKKLTFGPPITKDNVWIAMSPGSDPSLVKSLTNVLTSLKKEGTIDAVFAKYTLTKK